jgi:hypothetical protein
MSRRGGKCKLPHDYDAPYNPLPRLRGGQVVPTSGEQESRGWWVGGEWIEQPPPRKAFECENGGRISPIIIEDDTDSDCYEVPPPAPQGAKSYGGSRNNSKPAVRAGGPVKAHFDFNDGEQPLPWARQADDSTGYQVSSPYHLGSFTHSK